MQGNRVQVEHNGLAGPRSCGWNLALLDRVGKEWGKIFQEQSHTMCGPVPLQSLANLEAMPVLSAIAWKQAESGSWEVEELSRNFSSFPVLGT